MDLSAPLARGWALANCSGPVKANLLFRRRNSEGAPTAEAGVNATAVPATRFVTFAEQGEGQFGTGVAYANPSPNISVPVTFTVRDTAGRCWPASFGHCHPEVMMLTAWRSCLVSPALPDRSKSPPRSPSSVCRSMPKPLPYSPPCLRGTGCFRAVICRLKPSFSIDQDCGFRFRQPQPSGNPIQSLDILRLSRPAQQICKRLSRFRRVSCDVGCHPKDFLHIECASDPDRCRNLSQRA